MPGRHTAKAIKSQQATAAPSVTSEAAMPNGISEVAVGPVVTYGPLRLSDGTTRVNISAFYWLALSSILIFTFIPAAQAALLSTILDVPTDQQGSVVGLAGFIGELVLIVTVGISGALSDRIGRRPVAVMGYVLMAVSIAIAPFIGSVIPYYASRAIGAVGTAMITVMLTVIITDYVRNETRGKANGILGICNGVGAVVTFFVLLKLPAIFENAGFDQVNALRATYLLVAALGFLTAVLLQFTLRGGKAVEDAEEPPLPVLIKEGIVAAREPGVSFAYASAFVARADLALVGAFLTLWAQQYATENLGLTDAQALAKAGTLVGVANGIALIGAPIIGIASDRLSRATAVLISLGLAAVAYTATLLVDNPFSPIGYLVISLIGLGQVFCVISSQVLIAEQAPLRTRGSVIGMFALSGGVGILIAFAAGGFLFDSWRPAGPFVLFGLLTGAAFAYGLAVRSRIRSNPHEDFDHLADLEVV